AQTASPLPQEGDLRRDALDRSPRRPGDRAVITSGHASTSVSQSRSLIDPTYPAPSRNLTHPAPRRPPAAAPRGRCGYPAACGSWAPLAGPRPPRGGGTPPPPPPAGAGEPGWAPTPRPRPAPRPPARPPPPQGAPPTRPPPNPP